MSFRFYSIRKVLLVSLIVPLVGQRVISGYLSAERVTAAFERTHDRTLQDILRSVGTVVADNDDDQTMKPIHDLIRSLSAGSAEQFYFQITTAEGSILGRNKDLPVPKRPCPEPVLETVTVDEQKLRLASWEITVQPRNEHPQQHLMLQLAETTASRDQDIGEGVSDVMIWSGVFICLVCAIVFLVVRWCLRPLDFLQSRIRERSLDDLHPITTEGIPEEVRPLVDAINFLFKRIRDDVAAQQHLIDNAAHQLKTPLAGIRNLAELALRKGRDNELHSLMEKLIVSVDRTTNLSKKLLSFSRASFSGGSVSAKSSINLLELAEAVIAEYESEACSKHIRLELTATDAALSIVAEPVEIFELLANVVENAIRYCPQHSTVSISLKQAPDGVHISVLDDGPGVAEEEREKIFERFYRILGSDSEGSGLGLSIVKEVASHYNARVTVGSGLNGRGLGIAISFPLSNEGSRSNVA